MAELKTINCKVCGNKMQLFNSLRPFCGYECGSKYGIRLLENKLKKENKEERAELKTLKESLLTHKDYIKLLQVVFNTWIRKRDENLPCVSCGVEKCEEFHAGHYIASTYQYLRFNENNVWRQCSRCNTHLRGNSIPYRIELIKRIGLKEVEYLEDSRHMMLQISIPEIKEQIIHYKQKIKSLL